MRDTTNPQEQVHRQELSGLQKLLTVTRELAALNRLDDVLAAITSRAREGLSCERATMYLYDLKRDELYSRVATKLEIEDIRFSTEEGIAGWVARRRRIANIPDPKLDARWHSGVDRRTGFETRNILAAPLISQRDERLLGVLQLLNKREGEFSPFDEQLVEAFAAHAAAALERAELLEEARRSQELKVAVEVARRIQTSFLPEGLFAVPGYDVAAWWEPAEQVSGDYYDLFPLADGRTGLVVADVSGHGVGPSLIMASVRAMLRVLSRTLADPLAIVARLTECLLRDLQDGRFMTFLLVALDPRTGESTWTNAGHAPAFVFRQESGGVESLRPTTLPLGFPDEAGQGSAERLVVRPGDLLVLATDGIVELRNEEQELFGQERLERVVRQQARHAAAEVVEAVRHSLREFASYTAPPDDMTLMVVRCVGE